MIIDLLNPLGRQKWRHYLHMGLARCRIMSFQESKTQQAILCYWRVPPHTGWNWARLYPDVLGGKGEEGTYTNSCNSWHRNELEFRRRFKRRVQHGATSLKSLWYYGLCIPSMVWRELDNFSSGSVCLVLASEYFNEQDHIRDHDVFRKYVRTHQEGLKILQCLYRVGIK